MEGKKNWINGGDVGKIKHAIVVLVGDREGRNNVAESPFSAKYRTSIDTTPAARIMCVST